MDPGKKIGIRLVDNIGTGINNVVIRNREPSSDIPNVSEVPAD